MRIPLWVVMVSALAGQSVPPALAPGLVEVAATITASAGSLVCSGSAAAGARGVTWGCVDGSAVVLPRVELPAAAAGPGGTVITVQRGGNTVSVLVAADRWEVVANDARRGGVF
jgi:hypothetical protein